MEKVRGLQRSGTNLLQQLLSNCQIQKTECSCCDSCAFLKNGSRFPHVQNGRWQPCWKHWRIQRQYTTIDNQKLDVSVHSIRDLDTLLGRWGNRHCISDVCVVAVKSPIAWLLSDMRFHKKSEKPLLRERDYYLTKKLQDWIAYYQKWIELKQAHPFRVRIVPYESLLNDTESTLRRYVGTDLIEGDLRSCSSFLMSKPHIPMSGKQSWRQKQKYYLSCQPADRMRDFMKSEITIVMQEEIAIVNRLNSSLLLSLGYLQNKTNPLCVVRR